MVVGGGNAPEVPSTRWRGRVAVSCRMRPLLDSEAAVGMRRAPWLLTDRSIALGRRSTSRPSTAPAAGRELGERTGAVTVMDAVFGERVTTREVYARAFREIVAGAAEGLNGAIMAYGQTSSGKTYSISGTSGPQHRSASSAASSTAAAPEEASSGDGGGGSSSSEKGLIHFALEDLFSQLRARRADGCNCAVSVSYCEVYMERVNDLLRSGDSRHHGHNLIVKEDAENRSFYVEGLRERPVTSAEEVIALLMQAEKRRRVASTRYNEVSSRSHTLLTLLIELSSPIAGAASSSSSSSSGRLGATHVGDAVWGGLAPGEVPQVTRVGRLVFVDLAGNERVEAGAEYIAESNSINKSLFFLGKVIERLAGSDRRPERHEAAREEYLHVRDSNLTRLLSPYLGGNSRTGLLVTLTPSLDSVEESLATLRFAQKASTIRSIAQPVFVSKEQSIINKQQETISQLQSEVQELREWHRLQRQQLQEPSGAACRAVHQLREENSRLRQSIRYYVEERRRHGEAMQDEQPEIEQESTCKRSDGTPADRSWPGKRGGRDQGNSPLDALLENCRGAWASSVRRTRDGANQMNGLTSSASCSRLVQGSHIFEQPCHFQDLNPTSAVSMASNDASEAVSRGVGRVEQSEAQTIAPLQVHGAVDSSSSDALNTLAFEPRRVNTERLDPLLQVAHHPDVSAYDAQDVPHEAYEPESFADPASSSAMVERPCDNRAQDLAFARQRSLPLVGMGDPLRVACLDDLCLHRPPTLEPTFENFGFGKKQGGTSSCSTSLPSSRPSSAASRPSRPSRPSSASAIGSVRSPDCLTDHCRATPVASPGLPRSASAPRVATASRPGRPTSARSTRRCAVSDCKAGFANRRNQRRS